MRRIAHGTPLLLAVVLLLGGTAFGQSLGEVARAQRQKQKAKETQTSGTPRKVVTDEDMPEHPEAAVEDSTSKSDNAQTETPKASGQQSAEAVKAAITAQKNVIASLQTQCDKLSESIHYVQANLYVNGAEYNRYQQQKQQQLQRAQAQLADQKKKLEDMQEAARHAGFGSAVYDP